MVACMKNEIRLLYVECQCRTYIVLSEIQCGDDVDTCTNCFGVDPPVELYYLDGHNNQRCCIRQACGIECRVLVHVRVARL